MSGNSAGLASLASSSEEPITCQLEVLLNNQLLRVIRKPLPDRSPQRAVVFVHGFLGDYKETWTNRKADVFFPFLLACDPELIDYDVYIFQYVTKDFAPPAIDNVVNQLRFALNEHLHNKSIVFVAHSLGGLVSMRCILRLLEELDPPQISGLLLYGTPMSGVEWAKYARFVLRLGTMKVPLLGLLTTYLSANKQIDALTAGSQFVEVLNANWILRVLNGGFPKVPAAQRAWFPVRVVSANDDWVVKESSARGFYSEIDWLNVDCDHRALVKPEDRGELSYQIARNFLKQCREWLSPQTLLKLREQLDDVWNLHLKKPIADWYFELSFESEELASTPDGFGLAHCRPFRVAQCTYQRRIENSTVKFGFAIGDVVARGLWSDQFVFLHSIKLAGLPEATGRTVREQLGAVLRNRQTAWPRLFEDFGIRMRLTSDNTWHTLQLRGTEFVEDGLAVTLGVPDVLVGQDCVIDISFRSLIPSGITDYTVQFPWLCSGFRTRVTVNGGPSYLVGTTAMRGNPKIGMIREGATKLEYSSADLVLPESFIRFEWEIPEGASA